LNDIRVAIIGCGKIADQHAFQIQRVRGSRLVAVCDREKLMADQLAERFQVASSFDDVETLLKEARPDVVHVTTPPQTHYQLAQKCLVAGCHVYVEKPFSMDLKQAQSMVAMAEQRGLKITAGHNVQFNPEMVRMRELVRAGALGGPPVHIESVFSYSLGDPSYVKSLLGDHKHWVRSLPGKLLQNVISHGIAKIAEFFDTTPTVLAHGFPSVTLRNAGETDIVDELRVIISDNRRSTAYFTFTTQIAPPVQELRLFGPKGTIVVDNLHRTVMQFNRSNSDFKSYLNFFVPPYRAAQQSARNMWRNVAAFLRADFHMDAGMKNLIEAFYRSIQTNGPPPISHREILLTAGIMDDVFCQIDSSQRMAAAQLPESRPAMELSRERL
jgi:predicted dehydrogenase